MLQYLPDDFRVFYAGNDAHGALTLLTRADVDVEYPLQPLGPGHGGMALGRCLVIRVVFVLIAPFATSRWSDQGPVFAVGSEHAMEAGEIHSWFGHQGGQSG